MELDYNLWLDQFRLFLLVFTRITTLAAAAPILGSILIVVPPHLIAGLGGALSLLAMMNLPAATELPPWGAAYALMVAGEAFMGLSLGFLATLILAGLQFGGEVIDHVIGFAVVDVIDPITNESASLIGNFKGLLGTVLFLLFNGHHALFRGLMRTFELVPPGHAGAARQVWPLMEKYAEAMFVVGVQVAAPCLLVMTLLYVPEGFLARMVPQINLLINDVPFRIAIGLFVVWLGFGPFIHLTEGLMDQIGAAADLLAAVVAGA